jgi:hypothetical protein
MEVSSVWNDIRLVSEFVTSPHPTRAGDRQTIDNLSAGQRMDLLPPVKTYRISSLQMGEENADEPVR